MKQSPSSVSKEMFMPFAESLSFTTLLTTIPILCQSNHSMRNHPLSVQYTLKLSSCLRRDLCPPHFATRTLYSFIFSPILPPPTAVHNTV